MTSPYYGGLTSQTGSIGGGGDGSRHDDNRGVFFPEFDEWALQNDVGLTTTTKCSFDDDGFRETLTMIIDFNDGAWRPSSTIVANPYLPKKGDKHPTIDGCFLETISIQTDQGQPDLFRATLEYSFPDDEDIASGSEGRERTPLDDEFKISWSPTIEQTYPEEDLDGTAIRNPNGEAYEITLDKVRLDGICTWNQRSWSSTELDKWSNKINKSTWREGEYSFKTGTVLLHYVVGNLSYYNNSNGRRVPYYQMQAAISYDSKGIGEGDGFIDQRIQGSYYFPKGLTKSQSNKRPKAGSIFPYDKWDLDEQGFLLSDKEDEPTTSNPKFDYFRLYDSVKFSFVDR